MSKKSTMPEISVKSTKEQILTAYNEVLAKLNDKQLATPQEQKKQQEKQELISKVSTDSSDSILTELSSLKSKTIKQIDNLSEQLLSEFEKLANLREAIVLEGTVKLTIKHEICIKFMLYKPHSFVHKMLIFC